MLTKYIRVPPPVVLDHVPGGQTLSLSDLVRKVLIQDPRTIQDLTSITRFMELKDEVAKLLPGEFWALSGETHEFLSLLVRTFPNYHPDGKLAMLPLIHAILSATTDDPAVTKTPSA